MIINKIISLEEDTCCHRAAQHMIQMFDISPEIIFVKSFEEARNLLIQMNSSDVVMLVPHVNDMAKDLTFTKNFQWNKNLLFALTNPKLFLVKKPEVTQSDISCAALPVLQNLVDKSKFSFVEVFNTQEAARFVKEGKTVYGITNESGLQKYGLEPVEELKPMEVVWFSFNYKI